MYPNKNHDLIIQIQSTLFKEYYIYVLNRSKFPFFATFKSIFNERFVELSLLNELLPSLARTVWCCPDQESVTIPKTQSQLTGQLLWFLVARSSSTDRHARPVFLPSATGHLSRHHQLVMGTRKPETRGKSLIVFLPDPEPKN